MVTQARRRLIPEQVQTSAMDCGPAALTALLGGYGIQASYGRLREACQTSVDGTSIDTIEEVALQLGLDAEQTILPVDFLLRDAAEALPALVVVVLPSGAAHFIVVWSRLGNRVQVMDPAVGRRWRRWDEVARELYIHTMPVPAEAWLEWAHAAEAQATWRVALRDLAIAPTATDTLLARATAAPDWQALATLDAATRLAATLVRTGGLAAGAEAQGFIEACVEQVLAGGELPLQLVPAGFWYATPAPDELVGADGEACVMIRGAVLLRVRGTLPVAAEAAELPADLAAALHEPPPQPDRLVLTMLGRDGWLPPGLLMLAMLAAAAGVTTEAVILQGVFRTGAALLQSEQRGGVLLALALFLMALWAVDLLGAGLARLVGRRLEVRLRIALLTKLPRLGSQYFHSRLVSDMAGRAHSLRQLRTLPAIAAGMIQTLCQLILTTIGLIWLSPQSVWPALGLTVAFGALMVALTPLLSERQQRVRAHNGAISQIYLDALHGLAPLRLHGAERAVQREHEHLLATWWGANAGLIRTGLAGQGLAGVIYVVFAVTQVIVFLQTHGSDERILLLLYWTLNLPVLAQGLITLVQQYPSLRALVLSLLEPLGAPDEEPADADQPAPPHPAARSRGPAITLEGVTVRAGGHTILDDLHLTLAPGEHVAVVGPSGAGKSSLAGLLLGWHRAEAGRCLIDGRELDGALLQEVRRTTAWVDPAVQIWNRSLMHNLAYGNGSAGVDPQIIEQAELLGVLERLPAGLQTPLGESGGLVSGGEGQRVRLGRALGHPEPRLVVLDEPFRGLDRSTRARLLARVRTLWADATLICITHDVAETQTFSRVLVIDGGRIAEDGAPAQLAADADSRYRALLDAEERVRDHGWGNPAWRKIRLVEGRVEG